MSEYVVRLNEYGQDLGDVHGPTDRESAIEAAKDLPAKYADGRHRVEPGDYKATPSDAWMCEGYVKVGMRSYRVEESD